jgi:uncharacterized protein YeaO (DUF488 family)
MVRLKRIYEAPAEEDGVRVLVDRLWPRGVSKEAAAVAWWARELAPSSDLRRWFGHDPARFEAFAARYRDELRGSEALARLRRLADRGTVTLLYAARDERHNNARVLAQMLEG